MDTVQLIDMGLRLLGALANTSVTPASAAAPDTLVLERKIPLGNVSGRIDHFALDAKGRRLFLAELGNDSVSVVDIDKGTVVRRVNVATEPQGVAYVPEANALYVASGSDGSVRVYDGGNFTQIGNIDFKNDADNLRFDASNHLVYVGFGSGGLGAIDVSSMTKKAEAPLKAHPEGFQLEPNGQRAFVNVPGAHEVAVVDRATGQQIASWHSQPDARSNFPMAVRSDGTQILVGYRSPARLVAFDTKDGHTVFNVKTCSDTDDVFIDEKRQRAYVSCGEGVIDVFQLTATSATQIGEIKTSSGARTAFYDTDLDRLFLAVRAASKEPAAIWVYKPIPPP